MNMRQPMSEIVIGQQGVGKTYISTKFLKYYTQKYKRSVLIVDKNGEYGEYKAVYYDPDEENRHKRAMGSGKSGKSGIAGITKPRIYRILCFHKNGRPMDNKEMVELIMTITDYYTNGLLVLEEMNTYIRRHVPEAFYGFLVRLRHRGIDLISHFQRVGDPHPDIWGNAKSLRLHKAIDSVRRSSTAEKVPNYELVRVAEMIVEKHYLKGTPDGDGKYYFNYVDFNKGKLRGSSEEDFREAMRSFLLQNPREVKDLMAEEDDTGHKLYPTKTAAIDKLIDNKLLYIKK